MNWKNVTQNIFAIFGFILILSVVLLTVSFQIKTSNNDSSLKVPLKKDWSKKRYFNEINTRPLAKTKGLNVTTVKVIDETPASATFRISFDANEENIPEPWQISVSLLKDSGWPPPHTYYPAEAPDRFGKLGNSYFAIIKLEYPEEAVDELLISNHILVAFYKNNPTPHHEVKYEYERVWCRQPAQIDDLWKTPYPEEKSSKYSVKGSRSISRICLKN